MDIDPITSPGLKTILASGIRLLNGNQLWGKRAVPDWSDHQQSGRQDCRGSC